VTRWAVVEVWAAAGTGRYPTSLHGVEIVEVSDDGPGFARLVRTRRAKATRPGEWRRLRVGPAFRFERLLTIHETAADAQVSLLLAVGAFDDEAAARAWVDQ